jgi:hypothetical protein
VKLYAGIGSRQTPLEILKIMRLVGQLMAENDWILRSGAAIGADAAFEEGCDKVDGSKEIFLPWKEYNHHSSPLHLDGPPCKTVKEEAYTLAEKYHPAWDKVSGGAKRLLARNGFQVLGANLQTPVQLVVCWTPYVWHPGVNAGGTAQALRIAHDRNIPILNLKEEDTLTDVVDHLKLGIPLDQSTSYDLFEDTNG